MKKKGLSIYSWIVLSVFIFSVFYFAYNMMLELKTASQRTTSTFGSLVVRLQDISSQGASSDEELKSAIVNIKDFAALYIEKNGIPLYSYPNENAKDVQESRFTKLFNRSFKTTRADNQVDNYNLVASVYTLRPSVVFYYARFSFILVMAATLLTVALIVYFSMLTNTDDYIEAEEEARKKDKLRKILEEDKLNKEVSDKEGKVESENKEVSDTEATEANSTEDKIDNKESVNDTNTEEGKKDGGKSETDRLQDIYSKTTGVLREGVMNDRLEDTLIKAASQEEDLLLFIMRLEGYEFTNAKTKEVVDYLLSKIQFRDRIFEYSTNAFAFIKYDLSIDEAEEFARGMIENITNILQDESIKCFVGVSARGERMLNAARLIKEASEALRHAESEDSPKIVVFKVDIDKYRKVLNDEAEKNAEQNATPMA